MNEVMLNDIDILVSRKISKSKAVLPIVYVFILNQRLSLTASRIWDVNSERCADIGSPFISVQVP